MATLGDIISQIERWTGSSISDPLVLKKEVALVVGDAEVTDVSVDVDGDVIVLGD